MKPLALLDAKEVRSDQLRARAKFAIGGRPTNCFLVALRGQQVDVFRRPAKGSRKPEVAVLLKQGLVNAERPVAVALTFCVPSRL